MKKCVVCFLCIIPLSVAGAISLGWDFIDWKDFQTTLTLGSIFGLMAMMIIVSKLFFDFLTVILVNRMEKTNLTSGVVLNMLSKGVLIQGFLAFVSIGICSCFACDFSKSIILAFAVINTVYYYVIGKKIKLLTSSHMIVKCFAVYSCACWVFCIYRFLLIYH